MVNVAEIYLQLFYKEGGRYALKHPPPLIHYSTATATRLAIARAFLARFARGRIHGTRVIAFCLPSAIGTRHFIRVHFYQFFKLLSALCAFIL